MMQTYPNSSVLTPLVLLMSVSLLHLSTSSFISNLQHADGSHRHALSESENLVQSSVQEEQEELFKDIDPRTLAAVLLEALNHSRVEKEKEGKEGGLKDERGVEGADRHRDGRQELEMLIASQGKDWEKEEEEERKKALEEEEKMTEKVTSRTTSQTIPIQMEQQPGASDGGVEGALQSNPEEEEQLSPEELKSLETMMKEFPRLDTKTEEEPQQMHRENRAYSSYNDIIPVGKGSDLAMSKKKLKWQEETQKALLLPTFTGSNSLDEGKDRQYGSDAAQQEEEVEEEVLSPQEEEARARVEQEEMMRQAAEAQRAKLEEEKLADMASDMLLRYMVKENNRKYGSSVSNAAEDKRSEEELDQNEEEDIDPQTIDKLIEISNKLHLPADDVVDIITDVEKKKKKDVPPEVTSAWQRPPSPQSSSFLPGWQVETSQNNPPVSKQPSPAANLLKSWFQKKKTLKSEDSQRKLSKFWSKPERSRLKSSTSLWANFPYISPPYHQRRVFPDYYPNHVRRLPGPKSRYYHSKPALTFNNFLDNSVDDTYTLQPRWYYPSWIHPQLREPPMSYYPPITYPRPFLRAQPPPQTTQKQFYGSALGRNRDYYESRKPLDSSLGEVEKYIQQILKKRPQRMN
ncbi:neurosecretory protein VGF [Melanotaenia boesemani]|uniref:neurosecretory protein VGF n=1 Tax=Melanotaenia boesemani TaxID=1250792 RepID=UPI001C03FD5B|nr:neurosecretory protein VGF [Melanotaenia boesemani]